MKTKSVMDIRIVSDGTLEGTKVYNQKNLEVPKGDNTERFIALIEDGEILRRVIIKFEFASTIHHWGVR